MNTSQIKPSISLVIPVFNNAATAEKQLQKCIEIMNNICKTYEIIVSNDASTDLTEKALRPFSKRKHVKIYKQKKNLGISKNIRFLYGKASCDYVMLFSIDGGWDPNDIQRLARAIQNGQAAIVIGKRSRKVYVPHRHIISLMYNLLPVLLFGVKTHDAGSIKVFKRSLLKKIKLVSRSIFFEAELIIKAKKLGYTVRYVPINHMKENKKTKSGVNMHLLLSSFHDMLKLRLQML